MYFVRNVCGSFQSRCLLIKYVIITLILYEKIQLAINHCQQNGEMVLVNPLFVHCFYTSPTISIPNSYHRVQQHRWFTATTIIFPHHCPNSPSEILVGLQPEPWHRCEIMRWCVRLCFGQNHVWMSCDIVHRQNTCITYVSLTLFTYSYKVIDTL